MRSMRMRPIATDVALSVWVFLCVATVNPAKTWTDWDAVWGMDSQGPGSPHRKGQFSVDIDEHAQAMACHQYTQCYSQGSSMWRCGCLLPLMWQLVIYVIVTTAANIEYCVGSLGDWKMYCVVVDRTAGETDGLLRGQLSRLCWTQWQSEPCQVCSIHKTAIYRLRLGIVHLDCLCLIPRSCMQA